MEGERVEIVCTCWLYNPKTINGLCKTEGVCNPQGFHIKQHDVRVYCLMSISPEYSNMLWCYTFDNIIIGGIIFDVQMLRRLADWLTVRCVRWMHEGFLCVVSSTFRRANLIKYIFVFSTQINILVHRCDVHFWGVRLVITITIRSVHIKYRIRSGSSSVYVSNANPKIYFILNYWCTFHGPKLQIIIMPVVLRLRSTFGWKNYSPPAVLNKKRKLIEAKWESCCKI